MTEREMSERMHQGYIWRRGDALRGKDRDFPACKGYSRRVWWAIKFRRVEVRTRHFLRAFAEIKALVKEGA